MGEYYLKAHIKALGITSKHLISQLQKQGYDVNGADFSRAINGKYQSAKMDILRRAIDELIGDIERKFNS